MASPTSNCISCRCACALDSPTALAGETSLHWLALDTVGDAALPAPVRRLFARSDLE
jgi:hypothetical protein